MWKIFLYEISLVEKAPLQSDCVYFKQDSLIVNEQVIKKRKWQNRKFNFFETLLTSSKNIDIVK